MTTIKLRSLRLRNFKKIKDLLVDVGENTVIRGQNGVGKTTIYDAFCWLLTGKDSLGRSDFEIKTVDPTTGEVLHNLEHEVKAVLDIDGVAVSLGKILTEKWTKKRGSATAEFTGHSVQHYVNGVPISEGEYKSRVAEIAPALTWNLLTSPRFFNDEKLFPWTERRRLLLEVCGNITMSEVVASLPDLAGLPGILAGHSLDEHRKVIAASRRQVNGNLEKIPVRIDEVSRSLPDITGIDTTEERTSLIVVEGKIRVAKSRLEQAEAGGELVQKRNQKEEIRGQMLGIENAANCKRAAMVNTVENEKHRAERKKEKADDLVIKLLKDIAQHQNAIDHAQGERERLRNEWTVIYAEDPDHLLSGLPTVCPACEQDLPADRILQAQTRALAQWKQSRSARLEDIQSQGMRLKTDQEIRESLSVALGEKLTTATAEGVAIDAEIAETNKRIMALSELAITVEPEYLLLSTKVTALEADINALEAGKFADLSPHRDKIRIFEEEKADREARLKRVADAEAGQARIAELATEEKRLAGEYEKLARELYLLELYEKTEAGMLEGRVNEKFAPVEFKLFDQAINGGITPTCKTMYHGVQWDRGLNPGFQVNAGRRIINVLSEHFGILLPCFADNTESVTELLPSPAQTIRIIHNPDCKKLTITEGEK